MTVQAISELTTPEKTLYDLGAPDELDKMDFLNLLTTQLQYQDPLDPEDPTEFTSQLAEFSALEQMMNLNDAVETLQLLEVSTNSTLAASLVGREVTYAGDAFEIEDEGTAPNLEFYSPSAVESATIYIHDENGSIVRMITDVDVSAGVNSVSWNGRQGVADADPALSEGSYTFSVSGNDGDGNAVSIEPLTQGVATGVVFEDGMTYLEVNGARITLGEIYSVGAVASDDTSDDSSDDSDLQVDQVGARGKNNSRDGVSIADVARALATTAVKAAPLFL